MYNGGVGGVIKFLWLLLVLCLLILLGQSLAFYTLPLVPDLRAVVLLVEALRPGSAASPQPLQATQKPSPAPSPAPTQAAVCAAGTPRFVNGAAGLKAMIGADMGDPVECERVVDAAGNTEQKTTTGLVYYRADTNITAFTNGFEHWALTSAGLARWTGDALDPPPDAEIQR